MRKDKHFYALLVAVAIVVLLIVLIVVVSVDKKAERVYFAEQSVDMDVNTARNLSPVIEPSGVDRDKITYYCGDGSIAEFDKDVLIAKAVGECTVCVECDGIVSDMLYVRVHDYMNEADVISRDIDKYIMSGSMNEYKVNELYSRYSSLPDYASETVENAWKIHAYRNFSDGDETVYISANGNRYHTDPYCTKTELILVPKSIIEYDDLQPCSRCSE